MSAFHCVCRKSVPPHGQSPDDPGNGRSYMTLPSSSVRGTSWRCVTDGQVGGVYKEQGAGLPARDCQPPSCLISFPIQRFLTLHL